jgi:hypothetical protein
VLNKIHQRTLKFGAACFTEMAIKIFSAIENPKTYISTKIKSISLQIQLNFISYIELHVSTYLRTSSGSQLVFKTY